MSVWGSPGFGKTSVATEVGHRLQTGGLLVYFFSMRGLLSKADLTTQLLSFFRRHSTRDQIPQQMSIEEELFLFLRDISGEFVMILDNADELLESGAPNVKEDFINLLEVILSQFKNLTFLLTTRESLEFMNVHFEGHQAVRIGPLHESFSQNLVGGLLPKATASDRSKIAKICGFVPLAMKLLCSSITEDNAQPSQFLDTFKESIESSLFELLDNPDYPSYLRLKFIFESSFQRLSLSDKKALASLSVLSGDFNHSVAAAVMGVKTTLEAKRILHRLQRKSFLELSPKPESFLMQLLLSLAFGEVTWGIHGRSMTLLSRADGLSLSIDDKRKLLCYKGICQLASGKIDDGIQSLQKALCLVSDSSEERILRVTALQILVTYFLFMKKKTTSLELYTTALHECRALGDTSLLVIPPVNNKELRMIEADMPKADVTTTQPLRLEMICVVSKATEMSFDYETKQAISKSVLRMSNEIDKQILPHSIGLWIFRCNVNMTLSNVLNNPEEASKLCDTWISYHKMTLNQSEKVIPEYKAKPDQHLDFNLHQEGLLRSSLDHGHALHQMQNYPGAIQSFQRALDVAIGLFREEHPDTAQSYVYLGVTKHALGNFSSALESKRHS